MQIPSRLGSRLYHRHCSPLSFGIFLGDENFYLMWKPLLVSAWTCVPLVPSPCPVPNHAIFFCVLCGATLLW